MVTEKQFTKKYGVKFTHHGGKLEGFDSLNTSVLLNKICTERAKDKKSICSKCYARNYADFRKSLRDNLAKNTEVLTNQIIPTEEWATLNNLYFRLESFGDLNNSIQVKNYFNFCKANKNTQFTLWTKNPEFIDIAIREGETKPNNLIIVQSSPHINVTTKPKYDFIDIVFTVFTKEYAEEHKVIIGCGGRKCLDCLKCYTKGKGVRYINELLK